MRKEDGAAEGQPAGGWCGRRHASTEDTAHQCKHDSEKSENTHAQCVSTHGTVKHSEPLPSCSPLAWVVSCNKDEAAEGQAAAGGWCGRRRSSTEDAASTREKRAPERESVNTA